MLKGLNLVPFGSGVEVVVLKMLLSLQTRMKLPLDLLALLSGRG